jgi:hypothetical protein
VQEQRQADAAAHGALAHRIENPVQGAGVIALAGFLQHVADVDGQRAEVAGHVAPGAVAALDLQARLVGGRQDGQQIDVAMRGGAHRTGRLLAGQRWVAQHAQQGVPAALDHGRQRLAVMSGDLGRRVPLDPAQQLLGQRVGLLVVGQRVVLQLGRDAAPGVDVEVLLDVLLRAALGRLADGGGEPAVLRFLAEGVMLLLIAVEEGQPVAVDALDQLLRDGVVLQHAEAGLVQALGEPARGVGISVVDDLNFHGRVGMLSGGQSRVRAMVRSLYSLRLSCSPSRPFHRRWVAIRKPVEP